MRALLAKLGHYASRFFGFFKLRPLRPEEQARVSVALSAAEAKLFWEMQPEDQRHSFDVAERIAARLPGDAVAYRAALLHDVGKRHAHLGAWSRSVATVAGHLGLPMTASMRAYWDHGPSGAADLAAAGSDPFVVRFAEHHPERTGHVDADPRWQVLIAADE